jgi:methylmalonyl-CoA/ethylmalonyl-CoA epimerase
VYEALDGLAARFDHVAVAAPSFELLLPLYRDALGGRVLRGGENTAFGFQTLHLTYTDNRHVELVAPAPGSHFLDRFLERTGGIGGVHHVTFRVADVALAIRRLNEAGYPTFAESPDAQAHPEAFVHPKSAHGVLLQVVGYAENDVPDARPAGWTGMSWREEKS